MRKINIVNCNETGALKIDFVSEINFLLKRRLRRIMDDLVNIDLFVKNDKFPAINVRHFHYLLDRQMKLFLYVLITNKK